MRRPQLRHVERVLRRVTAHLILKDIDGGGAVRSMRRHRQRDVDEAVDLINKIKAWREERRTKAKEKKINGE